MCLITAFLTYNAYFGRRYDKNPLYKYFTAQDFSLSAKPVSTADGLNGFIYRNEAVSCNNELVIFCHGMGPGQIAYTTEIAYFCNCGFTVLALDSRGCNLSEGKSIKGMYSGVQTAIAAIDYAKSLPDIAEKIYLVGHSWGAYSALCASAKRKVDGVVAISAPDTPSKTMRDAALLLLPKPLKPLAAILRPFWWLVSVLKYGAKGNTSASKCANGNKTPTLLVHGDKDKIVNINRSAYAKCKGGNITKLLATGKAHNPYNTENAERILATLSSQTADSFDFKAATEEDYAIMQSISGFINAN